jgi:cytoskeletal protein RodZ
MYYPALTTAALFTALILSDTIQRNTSQVGQHALMGFISVLLMLLLSQSGAEIVAWGILFLPMFIIFLSFIMVWRQSLVMTPEATAPVASATAPVAQEPAAAAITAATPASTPAATPTSTPAATVVQNPLVNLGLTQAAMPSTTAAAAQPNPAPTVGSPAPATSILQSMLNQNGTNLTPSVNCPSPAA